MRIPIYHTTKSIKKQYGTGEEPVLARCSDLNEYICKYMRSSATPYKLVCEVIGSILASEWGLRTPEVALIKLRPEHWTPFRTVNLSAPAFGSLAQKSVIDVTVGSNETIPLSETLQRQILNIALFDLWVANEDRNWNNANLMYDTKFMELIAIDHGCIFNTATFDFSLSLLTENESILYSELAHSILKDISIDLGERILSEVKTTFESISHRKDEISTRILDSIPPEWNVSSEMVEKKISELFETKWMEDYWKAFIDYFYETKNG